MRKYIFPIIFLFCVSLALAVPQSVTYNGKTYYVVSGDNPAEDSGDEVCAFFGKTCVGYTEPSSGVCQQVHPGAATGTGFSGDASGVYCNGAPQGGTCATLQDTCQTCPACTKSVACGTPVGGLYKEMYVECAAPTASNSCSVHVQAQNFQQLTQTIPGINAQLQQCPQKLPSGTGIAVSNGNLVVDVTRTNGGTASFTITINGGMITGVQNGASTCTQRARINEMDINNILASSNRGSMAAYLFGQKRYILSGCTLWQGIKTSVTGTIGRFFIRRSAPQPPPPPPAPNCGNYGEQCNNRGCFSGMCGAPRERNSNGQWGFWNYRCLNQQEYTANCIGRGNTAPAWNCVVNACR